jgi:hypothetical protein
MLAGLGAERLLTAVGRPRRLQIAAVLLTLGLLMASSLLSSRAADEVDGSVIPTVVTWALWIGALLVSLVLLFRDRLPVQLKCILPMVVLAAVMVELWLASTAMPYNDLVDPQVYADRRMSAYQVQALDVANAASDTSGRMLSISNLYFDPGDKAPLENRWRSLNMTERASRTAFTATKAKEAIAPNLPLVWGIPSIDGYGGGLLPTTYYTQFTSLLLPDGMPRTTDGRLRELLAQSACNGACIPDQRWLNLTNTRYLLLDKTFDLWQDDIAYDTAFTLAPGDSVTSHTDLVGTALQLLVEGNEERSQPTLTINSQPMPAEAVGTVGDFALWRVELPEPQALQDVEITFDSEGTNVQLRALTLVDARTGAFMQLPLDGWRLVLSSDIKLYENVDVLPRTFLVSDVQTVPTTWDGTEATLDVMREAAFDPARSVILASDDPVEVPANSAASSGSATITAATDTALEITVDTPQAAALVIADAWYPGWQAQVNGQPTDLYRADAMFRAVIVPAGESTVILTYAPHWLGWIVPVGLAAWGLSLLWVAFAIFRRPSPR